MSGPFRRRDGRAPGRRAVLPSRRDDEHVGGPGDRRQQGHRSRSPPASAVSAPPCRRGASRAGARPPRSPRQRRIVARPIRLNVDDDASVCAAIGEKSSTIRRARRVVNNAAVKLECRPHRRAQRRRDRTGDLREDVFGAIRVTLAVLPLLRRSARPRVVTCRASSGRQRSPPRRARRSWPAAARLQLVEGGAELGHGAVRQRAARARLQDQCRRPGG